MDSSRASPAIPRTSAILARRGPGAMALAYPAQAMRFAGLVLPGRLPAWIALQVIVATGAALVVIASVPLRRDIALPWPGLPPELALVTGLGFWLAFGMIGGVRAHARPGGSVMTFSMPFIVGGTVLGGPYAGALLGLVAELEVRELRTQPWYGTLANHAVSIIAAVSAAVVGDVARSLVGAWVSPDDPLAFFVAAIVTALMFTAVNLALVIPTLAFKGGISIREASRTADASFRATTLGEAILAWLMAAAYVLIGWWAPLACVALVLIVWRAHDQADALRHDPMTGLLNDFGMAPRFDAALAAARAGQRSAAFLFLDLDDFSRINNTYLEVAGDEVIRVTAKRLLATVRATDSVYRKNTRGDEFGVLLEELPDLATAVRLAHRLRDRVREPIHLRAAAVEEHVGASIGIVMLERETDLTRESAIALADARMQRAKGPPAGGIVFQGGDMAHGRGPDSAG